MLKATILTLGTAATLLVSSFTAVDSTEARRLAEGQEFAVDPSHSTVHFGIQHLKAAMFWGRFNKVSGKFLVDEKAPKNSYFEITIPVDSVDTNSPDRDKHLRSSDFFSAKEFPTLTLKSTSVEKSGDDTYHVVANLTMRGETVEVEFDAVHTGTAKLVDRFGLRSGYTVEFDIDRTEFGMDFYADSGVLGKTVKIRAAIEGMVAK